MPVVFYDGDVPMSLPEFGGMDTGFNYYHGADPSEYDLVVSNSEGGLERLRELGARRAEAVFWAADAGVLRAAAAREGARRLLLRLRRQVPARLDGGDGRRAEPRARPSSSSRSAGATSRATSAAPGTIGDVPFNAFSRAISQARINLNITRRSHATVYASSSCRPFELAAAGAAIVSNPYEGIERWFEPGQELLVVNDADEALAAYRELLADPGAGGGDGSPRARARPRRAHVRAPRAAAALARRARHGGGCPCLSRPPARDRPGPQRGGGRRRRRRGDPRVRPDARRRRDRRRLVRRDRAARRAPRARRSSASRSTSASAAPSRPASSTRSRTATTSSSGSTATASTIRSSSRTCSRRSSAATPTSSIGSRFAGGNGEYRAPFARRAGIRWFARLVSLLTRQKLTDTTSGFQCVNARAIRLFAADYPHDYPEVEAAVMVVRHRLRIVEVPATMRGRETGRSSITALRSLYYAIKVTLALFVGIFRRPVLPGKEVEPRDDRL